MHKLKAAVVGCGVISTIYLKNLSQNNEFLEIYAVSDLIEENARKQAECFGIKKIMTFEELLDCSEIQLLVILTTPLLHYEMCKKSILAGKHTYVEKPLAIETEEAMELSELAEKQGVLLGGAPDTFLGAGLQTARKALDDGIIGDVIGCTAFFTCPGHERWHPNPGFYYKRGAGPVFDMGPYYLTALVALLGSVTEVASFTSRCREKRVIESQPHKGEEIDVEVDTTVCGILRFMNGAIGNIMLSFDIEGTQLPYIEIYGTKGTLNLPNPDYFEGPVLLRNRYSDDFKELPLLFGHCENSRGIGIEDMARSILLDTAFRPRKELQLHIVEIMNALENKEKLNHSIRMKTKAGRPELIEERAAEGRRYD